MAQALADRQGRAGMTDDTPIHELSPQQATARLAALQADWDARNAPPPTDKPATPMEARARLNTLTADKDWTAKLEQGDVEVRKEFTTLTELAADLAPADRLDAAMRGEVGPGI